MNSLSNIPRQYYGQNTYKSKQASLGCRKGSSDLEDFSVLRAIEPSKWQLLDGNKQEMLTLSMR